MPRKPKEPAQPAPTPPPDPLEEAAKLTYAEADARAKAGLGLSEDMEKLRSLDADIPALIALSRQAEHEEAEREQAEAARAKTPLALRLEVVSCSFASATFPANRTMPEFRFEVQPCPFGKDRPDQDCRTCVHCMLIPYGAHLPVHERRYQTTGMVIPIADEESAEALAEYCNQHQLRPLAHPRLVTHAAKQTLQRAYERRQEVLRREMDRQQGKR